jgi:hypothetical protein
MKAVRGTSSRDQMVGPHICFQRKSCRKSRGAGGYKRAEAAIARQRAYFEVEAEKGKHRYSTKQLIGGKKWIWRGDIREHLWKLLTANSI